MGTVQASRAEGKPAEGKHDRLFDGQVFDFKGHRFRVSFPYDEDSEPPWERSDGHGPVSNWRDARLKRPGERVLVADRSTCRFYDWAGAIKLARKDGWGVKRPGTDGTGPDDYKPLPGESLKAYRARAVQADFDFLAGWANDRWHYCGVVVELADEDRLADEGESLWGIEDTADAYLASVAYDLAGEILARIEVDVPRAVLSEN